MLRWDWYGFNEKRFRTCYAELVFLHPVGSVGHVVHFDASGVQNIDALFLVLGWDRYRFDKKHFGTQHAKLFLHLLGSVSRVAHSGASGSQNVDAIFFLLGWDQYGSQK
jgi:hypothetical protein